MIIPNFMEVVFIAQGLNICNSLVNDVRPKIEAVHAGWR